MIYIFQGVSLYLYVLVLTDCGIRSH